MAFPPWKPVSDLSKNLVPGDDQKIEMGVILQQLNALKGLCTTGVGLKPSVLVHTLRLTTFSPTQDFNSLCALLTVERLAEHPDYQHWTVSEGRWHCFAGIRAILAPLLPGENTTEPVRSPTESSGLLSTIAMSLSYQTALSTDIPLESQHGSHTAVINRDVGYIVPTALLNHSTHRTADESAPTVTVSSPVRPLRSFEQVVPAPHLGYKVHNVAAASPVRPNAPSGSTMRLSPAAQQKVHEAWAQELAAHSSGERAPPSSHRPHSQGQARPSDQHFQTSPPHQMAPPSPPYAASDEHYAASAHSHDIYRAASDEQPPYAQRSPTVPSHAPVSAARAGQRGASTFMTEPQRLSIETGAYDRADHGAPHNTRGASATGTGTRANDAGKAHEGDRDHHSQPGMESLSHQPAFTPHGGYDPRNLHETFDEDQPGYSELSLHQLHQQALPSNQGYQQHLPHMPYPQSHHMHPYRDGEQGRSEVYQHASHHEQPTHREQDSYLQLHSQQRPYNSGYSQPQQLISPHYAPQPQEYGYPGPFPAVSGAASGAGPQQQAWQQQPSPHFGPSKQHPQYAHSAPTPNQPGMPVPPSQGGRAKAPAVAWTVEPVPQAHPESKPAVTPRADHSVLAAAFTVGEVDESKLKPMPAALRKKMLADQQAAVDDKQSGEQEVTSLAAERAASRGRSRSAPRGGPLTAVAPPPLPVNAAAAGASAGPGAGRPQSAVRMRPPGSNIPAPASTAPQSTASDRGARRNSDTASTGQPDRAGSQRAQVVPSAGSGPQIPAPAPAHRNLATAAPGSELSVHSDATRTTAKSQATSKAAASAVAPEYAPSVVFKSDFPLRCFSVLGVGADRGVPDSVRMAIGSNAKSIYTLSYARSELAASRNMGIVGGPGPGVTLQAELSNIHTGSVYCMDWHEGAGLLVSGSNDKVIRLSK
jgi:hypothetical protein